MMHARCAPVFLDLQASVAQFSVHHLPTATVSGSRTGAVNGSALTMSELVIIKTCIH